MGERIDQKIGNYKEGRRREIRGRRSIKQKTKNIKVICRVKTKIVKLLWQ